MTYIFEKYHSYIFAILSIAGFQLSAILANYDRHTILWIYMAVFLLLFIVESIVSMRYREQLKMKLPLPHIADESFAIHLSHHLILPLSLFIGVAGFIIFNRLSWPTELIVLLGGITFFSIFEGQRSSFKNDFIFSETLHYIYDSIKIIIYFLGIDIIIQAQQFFGYETLISFILAELLSFILFMLIIVRKDQFNSAGMLYIFLSSVLTSVITIVILPMFSPILVAIFSAVIFYLLVGLIHHKINATLTPQVITEYIVIAVIILLAIKGISL